jgi:hypothetical protein
MVSLACGNFTANPWIYDYVWLDGSSPWRVLYSRIATPLPF